jgi:hypothetical protein
MKNRCFLLIVFVLAVLVFSSCANPEDALYGEGEGIKFMASPDMDTYLDSVKITTNYGSCDTLKIGTGPYGAKYRAIMHFDLKAIPQGKSIEYAALTFSCTKVSGTAQIMAYPVTSFWQEGESPCIGYATFNATWRYANDTGPGGRAWLSYYGGGDYYGDTMTDAKDITGVGTYTFTVKKEVIKAWVDDWTCNYGLLIMASDEVTWDNSVMLGGREGAGGAVLRIRYK